MVWIFPKLKSEKNYIPYLNQRFERWRGILWKLLIILYLLEVSYLVEYAFLPDPDWVHRVVLERMFLWIYYLLFVGGRAIFFKREYANKIKLAETSDLIAFLGLVGTIVLVDTTPDAATVPITVFNNSTTLRFFAIYLVLSISFFDWRFQLPVVLSGFVSNFIKNEINYPGSEQYFLPSYIAIIFCFCIFCFSYEKIKRNNFEWEQDAISKEKAWKDILNELPEGIIVATRERVIIYQNSALTKLLGLNSENPVNSLDSIYNQIRLSISEYIRPGDGQRTHREIFESLNFHQIHLKTWDQYDLFHSSSLSMMNYASYKGLLNLENEDIITLDIKCAVKDFAGQPVAFFIFSDISERQKLEYLVQTIDYKERLLASVSHELRTPLNASLNFLESAIQDENQNEILKKNFLIPALRASRYLLIIINDIVDFSQMQSQRLRLFRFHRSIVQSVKDALEFVELQAHKKGLDVNFELPALGWDKNVRLDHNRLIQILTNLLTNALKFTFKGTITARIIQITEKILKFEVEDTGIGMSEEGISSLFSDSRRNGFSNHPYLNSQGIGLGLEISNEIAKLLRPRIIPEEVENIDKEIAIYVKSELAKGSLFWFYVEVSEGESEHTSEEDALKNQEALRKGEPQLSATPDENAIILPRTRPGQVEPIEETETCQCPKILAVDDDAFNLAALENILRSLDKSVQTAYNGKEALEIVLKRGQEPCSSHCKPFLIIFMDLNMPIMDGYECAKRLKEYWKENPSQRSILIACTAAVQNSERQKVKEAGMDAFLGKPVTKTKITEMVAKYSKMRDCRIR